MIGLTMTTQLKAITAKVRAFARSKRGNVAMIFAIAMVPLVIAAGTGLDFARAMLVRQQMTGALDAAGLAVGSSTGLDQVSAQALAQKYFDANYTVDKTAFGTPTVSIPTSGYNSGGSVLIIATTPMPTVLMKLAGITSVPVTASTTVVWGQSKMWVSLVLDNTGSMAQTDASGTSKISALQTASHQLLTILQNASATAGDVQVSVVPFAKLVNVGTSYVNASWIDWTDWSAAPPNPSSGAIPATTGPGDSCPWSTGSDGFTCILSPTSGSTTSTVPSIGTYTGYICPSAVKTKTSTGSLAGMGGHHFNGCYTSVDAGTTTTVRTGKLATCIGYNNCSCSGNNNSKKCNATNYTHTWTPNATSTWGGCIMDRTQNYDVDNTSPAGARLFPAANDDNCPATTVMSLGYNWTGLGNQIDAMSPGGSTNQTIGLAHGWQSLTTGNPYGAPTLPANTAQYIILVSDGLNTQDRWYGDGGSQSSQVDTRMALACTNAKAAGIVVYSIFVDLGGTQGNSTVLQNCATDSSKYFDLTTSNAIITTFNTIAQQITAVRVSK
jgi:Flp pilus assembly protein TadG